jgi:predicted permease
VHSLPLIARLREGVSLAGAQAEISTIAGRLRQTWGTGTDATDFVLTPLHGHLTQPMREGLWLMLGAVAILLVIACANASNLMLAQLATRQGEFAVRMALGASPWRIAQQLLTENLLLTLGAAALGAVAARWGVAGLLVIEGGNLTPVNRIAVDARVLVFAGGLAAVIAVALALVPFWRFRARPPQELSGRGMLPGQRLHGALIVLQIASTFVLLAGAGLLARSFFTLARTEPGFSADSTLAMTLALPSTVSPREDERLRAFYVQLLERLEQLPGVVAVGGINALPLAGRGASGAFLVDDGAAQRGEGAYRVASAEYFRAMGIPLLRGRVFDARDSVKSDHVAVISESLANRYWPNQDPLGKRIRFASMDRDPHPLHVVGIVGDVRNQGLEIEPGPTVYAYSLQRPQWWQVSRLSIVLRSLQDPAATVAGMRAAVQALRSDVPVSFQTLAQVQSASLHRRRFSLVLFGVFAGVALAVATFGVYGVTSYAVSRRTRELGLRMALGAQGGDILRLVLLHAFARASVGIVLGLMGAGVLAGLMKSLVFGVSTTDPLTLGLAAVLMASTTVAACWIPARRAAKMDPLVALRTE